MTTAPDEDGVPEYRYSAVDVPWPSRRAGYSAMGRRERAYAAELALKFGYPCVRSTWGYFEPTGQVVVDVPGLGTIMGVPPSDADATLARIEARFGAERRRQIEGGIA